MRRDEMSKVMKRLEDTKITEKVNSVQAAAQMKQTLAIATQNDKKVEMEKKQYMKNIMEENKKLMEYRQQMKKANIQKEKEAEKAQTELADRFKSFR